MEPGFDRVLVDLVAVARRAGLTISPAETLDAQRVAAAIGLTSRDDLRAALTAALVKRSEDRAAFERVFDGFFRAAASEAGAIERLRAEGVGEPALEALAGLTGAPGSGGGGGGGGLSLLLAGGAELDQGVEAALRSAGVSAMQSPMQVGLTALRALDALGLDRMQAELDALRDPLAHAVGAEEARRIADELARQIEALRRRVRARVREDFERANPDRLVRSRAARLERESLVGLGKDEIAQVEREVRKLGETLRDRLERKRRRTRRGRLDVRHTIRSSLRTGGVPFAPVFHRRRRDRPELLVLCDVSDSVRSAARFLLVLVYAMQQAFSRTRSFVFVRDLGEATSLFDEHPAAEAISLAFGGDAVPVGANSDYGRVFGQLVDRHLDAIGRRTTVVILGDARSNDLDPNLPALQLVSRRAARVLWLNPEPRGSWGFGDSVMGRYAPLCEFTASVRSLAELRAAVERLAAVVV